MDCPRQVATKSSHFGLGRLPIRQVPVILISTIRRRRPATPSRGFMPVNRVRLLRRLRMASSQSVHWSGPANLVPLGADVAATLLLLLLSISLSAAEAAADTGDLRVFYCIHSERSCKDTAEEVLVSSGDALLLARRALSTKDDFVGFVDGHQTTLQFYVKDTDSILVDMPIPQLKGSYAAHLNRAQALKLIAHLSPPLLRYRSELKLRFAKWQ